MSSNPSPEYAVHTTPSWVIGGQNISDACARIWITPDEEDVVVSVAENDPEPSADPEAGEMVAWDPVTRNWTGTFGTTCPLYVTVVWIWQVPPGVYAAGLAVTVTSSWLV